MLSAFFITRPKFALVVSVVLTLAGLIAIIVGFAMRMVISGRAPVTNMYESVTYVGLGTVVFGRRLVRSKLKRTPHKLKRTPHVRFLKPQIDTNV